MPRINIEDLPKHLQAQARAQIVQQDPISEQTRDPTAPPMAGGRIRASKTLGPSPWACSEMQYDSKTECLRAQYWSSIAQNEKSLLWFPHMSFILPCGRYTADFMVICNGSILIEDVKGKFKQDRRTETNRALKSFASAYPSITVRFAIYDSKSKAWEHKIVSYEHDSIWEKM